MSADLFISYAWTSDPHREWVRLLASFVKSMGFDVLIDADVDYGDGLNGFMRRATEVRHVLLVVDQNYVERANTLPQSGVGIENDALRRAYPDKPRGWLGIVLKDNDTSELPAWLTSANPKAHWFNATPAMGNFPGSEQIDELWRWIADLPTNQDNAHSLADLRRRAARLEKIDSLRDPASFACPEVSGEVHFEYELAPDKSYLLGHGEHSFKLHLSNHSPDAVYVYNDYIHAVGINYTGSSDIGSLTQSLTANRNITARVGDQVILMNNVGRLCVVDVLEVNSTSEPLVHTQRSIKFNYEILLDK